MTPLSQSCETRARVTFTFQFYLEHMQCLFWGIAYGAPDTAARAWIAACETVQRGTIMHPMPRTKGSMQ